MKILLDVNIRSKLPMLENLLAERGYDLVAMSDIAPRALDPDIIQIATQEDRTIITQDSDFSAHRFRDNLSMPYGVIFIDVGKYGKRDSDRQDAAFSRKLASAIDSIANGEYDLCETIITVTQSPNGTMRIRPKRDKNKEETSTGFVYIEECIGIPSAEATIVITTNSIE